MSTYTIAATYYTDATGTATLPDGKTWDDVEAWYIKWDTLFFKLKGEKDYLQCELNSDSMDGTDWKRPANVTVYPQDEDGETDYSVEVASMEN